MKKFATSAPFILLKNISKSYQEGGRIRCVLHNVNVDFYKGEFISLIGKSGSGKSTLLNIISGIDQLDSGTVSINGLNITNLQELGQTLFRRKNIGFIFQFFNLFPTLNVMENVKLPLELNGVALQPARNKAVELLTEVGLEDRLETFPDRLSGGEQQRVAIARALVHDPMLVLADEPTGNLDDETGKIVLELLDKLTRQSGRNLIMATHSEDNAIFSDRIFEISEGQLVEITPE